MALGFLGRKFHYKLTAYIVVLTLLVVASSSLLVHHVLKRDFTRRIEERLGETQLMVSRLMEIRRVELDNYSLALSEYQLVLMALRSPELDRATRDDILREEVLPYFSKVDAVLAVGADGQLEASSEESLAFYDQVKQLASFNDLLMGEEAAPATVFVDGHCYQVLGCPVYTGAALTHVLFTFMEVNQALVQEIHALSGVHISLFSQGQIFLGSEAAGVLEGLQPLISGSKPFLSGVRHLTIDGESFLCMAIDSDNGQDPSYLLSRSLDQELQLVHAMQIKLFYIAAFVTGLSLLGSYIFSRGVSRPIQQLTEATKAVVDSNFQYRVQIETEDEFKGLGSSFNRMIGELAEKDRIRSLMDKVVSREVAHELLAGNPELGGEEKVISILFTDIRGFTGISEKIAPRELLVLLNRYFACMADCIHEQGGVIDKYIGDAIMTLFGAPADLECPSQAAVLAGLGMLKALSQFNTDHAAVIGQPFRIGIGINTGPAIVGVLGTEHRLNYTAIGDQVNIASRLEGLCKTYGASIIISETAYQEIQKSGAAGESEILCRHLDDIRVRGRTSAVRIYEVLPTELDERYNQELVQQFKLGRDLMHARDFRGAQQVFCKILAHFPSDLASQVFLQKCKRYWADPKLYAQDYPDATIKPIPVSQMQRRASDRPMEV